MFGIRNSPTPSSRSQYFDFSTISRLRDTVSLVVFGLVISSERGSRQSIFIHEVANGAISPGVPNRYRSGNVVAGYDDGIAVDAGIGPMKFVIGSELYDHLEKVVDRFEDVANEINSIVVDQL